MNTMLAVISGDIVINCLLWLICAGVVFWLLNWLISYVGLPEPFSKVAKIILAIAAVIILINIVMNLAGHPMIRW